MSMIHKYADKFRLRVDECRDPYFKCKRKGFVYNYSDDTFGVWMESGKPNLTFRAINEKWPTAELKQVGDGEFTFIFKPDTRRNGELFLESVGAYKVVSRSAQTKLEGYLRLCQREGYKHNPETEARLRAAVEVEAQGNPLEDEDD